MDERLIEQLRDPKAYPHPAADLRVIQTHCSHVLLAGAYAYKIKKALNLGFLDYSSLAKRKHFCRQEVLLNRRLTSDVYLGVVPIVSTPEGPRIGGEGPVIEWAVRMRRLHEDGMLDHLIAAGHATSEMIEAVAETMARFHARAPHGAWVGHFATPHRVRRLWEENLAQLSPFVGRTVAPFQWDLLDAFGEAFLRRSHSALLRRLSAGRIRDCHGDLRASSICFDRGLQVFDCIEFNPAFRCGDVASEIAFLAMDLQVRGREDLAEAFVRRYLELADDPTFHEVFDFYVAYRAVVRAKVESLRSVQSTVPDSERHEAVALARRCTALACARASRAPIPTLFITYGLSGTGKTSIARALEDALPALRVSSDQVRKELAGLDSRTHLRFGIHRGIYSRGFTRRTYQALIERAEAALRAGHSVILDATFLSRWQRRLAARLAKEVGAYFICLECTVDEPTVRTRLEARAADPSAISDADWAVYLSQKESAEPPDELSDWARLRVDTAPPLAESVAELSAALERRFGLPRRPRGTRGVNAIAHP